MRDCHSILDLRERARRRLPSAVFHFLYGRADTEWTARRNTEAFEEVRLVPRSLVDVSTVRTATRIYETWVRRGHNTKRVPQVERQENLP